MRSLHLIAVICCNFLYSSAQSIGWWENVVHWDGVTHWERYINYMPGFLGPNALPVPHISNGSIDSINSFGFSGNYHFSKDDHTQNVSIYANYCLVKNKISFDVFAVPVEHFTMSHLLKEERKVFALHYYDRYAMGDVYLNTNIQLINNPIKRIQSALRIGYRFASSQIGAARFSDAPGYYFDISFSKTFHTASALKWIAMAGGYVWQCDNIIIRQRQDDAFLFGSGLEWNKTNTRIQTYIAGYRGYHPQSRDKPYLFRISLDKRTRRNNWFFQFQQGLHNFNYSSIEARLRFNFKNKEK